MDERQGRGDSANQAACFLFFHHLLTCSLQALRALRPAAAAQRELSATADPRPGASTPLRPVLHSWLGAPRRAPGRQKSWSRGRVPGAAAAPGFRFGAIFLHRHGAPGPGAWGRGLLQDSAWLLQDFGLAALGPAWLLQDFLPPAPGRNYPALPRAPPMPAGFKSSQSRSRLSRTPAFSVFHPIAVL